MTLDHFVSGQRIGATELNLLVDAINNAGGGGGGSVEVWKGTRITDSLSTARDTGIDVPSDIEDGDIFAIIFDNTSSASRSGSLAFTGEQLTGLSNVSVGASDPSTTGSNSWLSVDQGNSTDDEFFVGKNSVGSILIAMDANVNDNITVTLIRFG